MKRTKNFFGKLLCSDSVLKNYMSKKDFINYQNTKMLGGCLNVLTAKAIAKSMKKWALKMGATHYTHWFLPLTNKTAEKQVSFIEIDKNGNLVEDFDEKSLIKGEADASSFPNGGERLTFEARGYTVWDYTSPAFIKIDNNDNKVLCIPTAFCSYTGTALDEKTPLLRASESLNHQALRVLKHLGYSNIKKVFCNVGAEQEYFLTKQEDFEKRLDLKLVGRTLFGAKAIKSQESTSHYFGIINDDISAFMNEVDKNLWDMGVMAKIQHNEVAPNQHELVPIFTPMNIASDQNHLIMEVINKIAKKHKLSALFHEKPFANINGSGKHINISLATDTGLNLTNSNLKDKKLFLTFFVAMLSAINKYYSVIRYSTAYRGNDLRLGGDEAPPKIISVFVGENIEKLLNSVCDGKSESRRTTLLDTGVKSLPKTIKDFCDRNRTSPFAYSGNKFEFRMVGSSQSIAWPATCISTIYAKELKDIADSLDENNSEENLLRVIKNNLDNSYNILFDGNGYDKTWKEEAKKRGLKEYSNTYECASILDEKQVINLFEEMAVLTSAELNIRKNSNLKTYVETVRIEAYTMLEMLNKQIYSAINSYACELSSTIKNIKTEIPQKKLLSKIEKLFAEIYNNAEKLKEELTCLDKEKELINKAKYACYTLSKTMDVLRLKYDELEPILPEKFMPFANYDILLN